MTILCLSDLHLRSSVTSDLLDGHSASPFLQAIKAAVSDASPDVVVVTGDTVWARQVRKLSFVLRELIPSGIPIVATLGNHEFWGRTFEETLAELKEQTTTDENIFYLDLIGAVELGEFNFVGGTLFFDGSMRIRENQRVDEWDGWQDWRIGEIVTRYMEFNAYYVDMIKSKMKPGISTVLCTHHVPHVLLNGHEPSHYSFYSGMKDLVHELPFDLKFDNYLICGHTHRRVIGEVIPGFMCVNVGSDYDQLAQYTLEV